jgi:hypothetical protein
MNKILASIGSCALVAGAFTGSAFAQSPYSPPVQAPSYRYVLPPDALIERAVLPSGLVYEGRSVGRKPALPSLDAPAIPQFPAGIPLNIETKPRPASTGSSFQSMYA